MIAHAVIRNVHLGHQHQSSAQDEGKSNWVIEDTKTFLCYTSSVGPLSNQLNSFLRTQSIILWHLLGKEILFKQMVDIICGKGKKAVR